MSFTGDEARDDPPTLGENPGVLRATVTHGGLDYPFFLFDTPLGREVFQNIITGRTYPLPRLEEEVRTIVDIGANVGAATLYFALHCPRARVLAFEPAPRSYELLVRNTARLPGVQAFQYGLAEADRRALLYSGRADGVTNSVHSSPENTGHAVEVELRAARAVLTHHGMGQVDILKLDTEGCEVPILRSLTDLLAQVRIVFVEYHDEADRLEIDRLLASTHLLFGGRVSAPHRGEFCYVAKGALPTDFRGLQIRKTP